MSKPRVKVYGFLSLTKRQYVLSLVLGMLLLAALLGFWFMRGVDYLKHPWAPYLPLVAMAAVALEMIEVLVVFGKFRRLEAEERAKCEARGKQPTHLSSEAGHRVRPLESPGQESEK